MKYLVVYIAGMSMGNAVANFRHSPPTIKDIRDAEKEISNIIESEWNPIIVNWMGISEDSDI